MAMNDHTVVLLPTYTHSLICSCFKSIIADATEASNNVNTLPMTTCIGQFQTLIAICRRKTEQLEYSFHSTASQSLTQCCFWFSKRCGKCKNGFKYLSASFTHTAYPFAALCSIFICNKERTGSKAYPVLKWNLLVHIIRFSCLYMWCSFDKEIKTKGLLTLYVISQVDCLFCNVPLFFKYIYTFPPNAPQKHTGALIEHSVSNRQ